MISFDEAMVDQKNWLAERIGSIKTEHHVKLVTDWAESTRYLPPSVTSKPGMYSFDVCPYMREIADCMSSESPVREIDFIKGAQICATVSLLENSIGYYIEHENNCPMMLVTADKELADLRIDKYIVPLLENSGLAHLIQANDTLSKGKSGRTKDQLSWKGGGFLVPFGANSSNKLRSISIKVLLFDEIDGFKIGVGKDGDPIALAKARTSAYEHSRKIIKLSTPTIKGQSNIEREFRKGDQRHFKVPCKHCGYEQVLDFNGVDKITGESYGLVWETDCGVLVPDSVKYLCKQCKGEHTEADKVDMFANGRWEATAKSTDPQRRSYSLSGLYSPYGFKSWKSCVQDWLDAWDVDRNQAKSVEALQVFYNNIMAKPFRKENDKLKLTTMYGHRRTEYRFGEIPNYLAERSCDSEIMLLTCAVDVHKGNLAVAVFGWTVQHRAFLIDYWRLEGDCESLDGDPWIKLKDIIYNKVYIADDGKKYRIQLTLIDSGYMQHNVLEFCANTDGTIPIKGIPDAQKGATFSEFKQVETKMGIPAFNINVNFYKDRWYPTLKRPWIESGKQQEYCFNVPSDVTEKQLKELTVETKVEDINPVTNALKGFKWHRPSGADNELFDLINYNNAAIDILAWDILVRQGERDTVNWLEFWEFCRSGNSGEPYFYEQ